MGGPEKSEVAPAPPAEGDQVAPPPAAGDPVAPPGYRLLRRRRLLGSTVHAVWESPTGELLEWTSRRHRKGRPAQSRPAAGGPAAKRRLPLMGFAPRRLSWWVAVLFTVGSVQFVIGSAGAFITPTAWWPNVLYFAGSVLFTMGATVQLVEAGRAGRDVLAPARPALLHRRFLVFVPGRLDWNASVVQLTGTLLFNINCWFGMSMSLTHRQQDMRIWVPSTIASCCFVIASWLSFFEAMGTWFAWKPRAIEWWITVGSLLGSFGFLGSSIAGFFLGGDLSSIVTGVFGPQGEAGWLKWAVDGILLFGSLWFLVGTYLMIPESLDPEAGPPGPAPAAGIAQVGQGAVR